MHAEPSPEETCEIALSPELIAAVAPLADEPPTDLHVEAWQPSLLERAAAFFRVKRR
jgi:hypothetical protein